MSDSANVALVRSIYGAWERGDWSSAEWAHPEIEYVFADGPSPGRWTGLAGMAEGWREWLSAWEGLRGHAQDCRELDDERVLVLAHFVGRGRASGLDVGELPTRAANVFANIFHVRDGKVTRIVTYWDHERALADLGLASEGDAA
jgi:ketosteroid isomerase-like protein